MSVSSPQTSCNILRLHASGEDADRFRSLIERVLMTWDCDPYPQPTIERLRGIHMLWLLTQTDKSGSASSVDGENDAKPCVDAVIGAAGVVLCPLAGCQVEAYVQYVNILPAFRRQGLAKQLLQRLVEDLTQDSPATKGGSRPRLLRIRLHTMTSRGPEFFDVGRTLYEPMGFRVRRILRGYYEGSSDGVEMVLERRDFPRKRQRSDEVCTS